MNRINVLRESKFNKMTEVQMTHVKGGGICLFCVKRARFWKSGLGLNLGGGYNPPLPPGYFEGDKYAPVRPYTRADRDTY